MGDNKNYGIMPSFKNVGQVVVRIADLKKDRVGAAFGVVGFKIDGWVNIEERFKGFLTVGVERGGFVNWNRRFCVLDGRELKCWNYPQEENGKIFLQ